MFCFLFVSFLFEILHTCLSSTVQDLKQAATHVVDLLQVSLSVSVSLSYIVSIHYSVHYMT